MQERAVLLAPVTRHELWERAAAPAGDRCRRPCPASCSGNSGALPCPPLKEMQLSECAGLLAGFSQCPCPRWARLNVSFHRTRISRGAAKGEVYTPDTFLNFFPPGIMLGTGRKIHCNLCNWTGLVIQMRFPYLAASVQKDPPLCRSGSEKRPGPGTRHSKRFCKLCEESSVFRVLLPFCKTEIISQNPSQWDVLVQPLNTLVYVNR